MSDDKLSNLKNPEVLQTLSVRVGWLLRAAAATSNRCWPSGKTKAGWRS